MKFSCLPFVVFGSITSLTVATPYDDGNGVSSFIIGGDDAGRDEFPYFSYFYSCGGALIAKDIVLTAAHCNDLERPGYQVIINAYNGDTYEGYGPLDPNEDGTERFCVGWKNHPLYDDYTLDNDYAVCKLDRPVDIEFLELNEDDSIPSDGENLVVLGLSYINNDNDDGADVLQKLTVPAQDNQDCIDVGGDYEYVTDNMFCAGGELNKDACYGDSGGPIVKRTQQQDGTFLDTHVGLVSWGPDNGQNCGGSGVAANGGVYARTSTGVDWIRQASCDLGSQADWCPPPVPCDGSELYIELDLPSDFSFDSSSIYYPSEFPGDTVISFYESDTFYVPLPTAAPTETIDIYKQINSDDYIFKTTYCLHSNSLYFLNITMSQYAYYKEVGYRFYLDGVSILEDVGSRNMLINTYQTASPSEQPSVSNYPSDSPSGQPSDPSPSQQPSKQPSDSPSGQPSDPSPSQQPSKQPSDSPSRQPSDPSPSQQPSKQKSDSPSRQPSATSTVRTTQDVRIPECQAFLLDLITNNSDIVQKMLEIYDPSFFADVGGGAKTIRVNFVGTSCGGSRQRTRRLEPGTATYAIFTEFDAVLKDLTAVIGLFEDSIDDLNKSLGPLGSVDESSVTVGFVSGLPPTESPTNQPSSKPTEKPTDQPSSKPTEKPTGQPSSKPTEKPTDQPSGKPTEKPTGQPPSSKPTEKPTDQPSDKPTVSPTTKKEKTGKSSKGAKKNKKAKKAKKGKDED